MPAKIFINLPVADLQKSIEFFTGLGYAFDTRFTDETATCMIVSEEICVMLLTHEKFEEFVPKQIADAKESTEVLLCLSLDSREQVDDTVSKAVELGGSTYMEPKDHGFMYGHGFQDLDGHVWEVIHITADED